MFVIGAQSASLGSDEESVRINAQAADWVALESLLQVFPPIGELFAGDANTAADPEAIRLIESILKENPIMCHELHRPFHMALKLRQPCLADTSLAEFVARDHYSSFMDTRSSISSSVLKEMVIVQPRCWKGIQEPGLLEKQEGTEPYQPRDLYSDLLIAGARLNWPQSDLENWRTESTDWYSVPPMMGEELRTISECLETLYEVDPILRTTKSQVTSTDDGIHLISQLPNASRLRCKFDFWAPPSPPEIPDHQDGIPVDVWGQGLVSIGWNRMAGCFRACQVRTSTHPARHQVCRIQDARPWRGLGMPIWDLWRLYCLGLWSAIYPFGRHPGPIPTPDGSEVPKGCSPFAWGTELDYRVSVFMQEWMQMENQEYEPRVAEERLVRE
ncbi:hypothetical protein N7449_008063 [Penicillium cf. viridicatum]|uniref:Uncharacterized protein n=1 Tax=Penicillium cf. viridicatum TaxID=2972119 RepID=A0A9W9JJP7_9EURO|nr:hypothetical protein N7449_008063 [Penicillium cf. viridicatum]